MAGLDRCDDAIYKRDWMEQKGSEGKEEEGENDRWKGEKIIFQVENGNISSRVAYKTYFYWNASEGLWKVLRRCKWMKMS